MKIYTRTGDKGETSLLGGMRVPKNHNRVEACGTLDELNSSLGVSLSFLGEEKHATLKKELIKIQNDLIKISSALASPKLCKINGLDKRVAEFEKLIDSLTEHLPPLKTFILPGGGKAGALLHLSRAVARRAERGIVALPKGEYIDENILVYLNRLSDLLFVIARSANFKDKQKEITLKP